MSLYLTQQQYPFTSRTISSSKFDTFDHRSSTLTTSVRRDKAMTSDHQNINVTTALPRKMMAKHQLHDQLVSFPQNSSKIKTKPSPLVLSSTLCAVDEKENHCTTSSTIPPRHSAQENVCKNSDSKVYRGREKTPVKHYYNTGKTEEKLQGDTENLQNCCLRLMQQMGDVLLSAESSFSLLSSDLDLIMARSSKLGSRVAQLASFIAKLDHKKAKTSPRSCPPLPPLSSQTKPLSKEDISGPYNLFTPETRPPEVAKVYARAGGGRKKAPRPPTADFSGQTEENPYVDFNGQAATTSTHAAAPESTCQADEESPIYENAPPVLVSIDTSGSAFRRMSSQRRSASQIPKLGIQNNSQNSSQPPPRPPHGAAGLQGGQKGRGGGTKRGYGGGQGSQGGSQSSRNSRDPVGSDTSGLDESKMSAENGTQTQNSSQTARRKRRPRGGRRNTIGGVIDHDPPTENLDALEREKRMIFDDQILTSVPKNTSVDGFRKLPKDLSQNFISTVKHQFATLKRRNRRKAGQPDDPVYENLYEVSLGGGAGDKTYDSSIFPTIPHITPTESEYSGYNASRSISRSSAGTPTENCSPASRFNLPDASSGNLQTSGKSTSPGGSLKHMLRRTLSLRLPKRPAPLAPKHRGQDGGQIAVDDLYSSIPFRQKPIPMPIDGSAEPQTGGGVNAPPIPPKKRSAIPLTSQSQVIQMAAKLHRQTRGPESPVKITKMAAPMGGLSGSGGTGGGYGSSFRAGGKRLLPKQFRANSVNSLDSNWSVSGFEQDSQSSYREGYRLEYPLECKASPMLSGGQRLQMRALSDSPMSTKKLSSANSASSSITRGHQNLGCVEGLDYPRYMSCESEASVGEDSNFSCDFDGYFTSMHADSGLWDFRKIDRVINESLARIQEREGIKLSPISRKPDHGSTSTLGHGQDEESEKSQKQPQNILQNPSGMTESLDLDPLPEDMISPTAKLAFPSICDISSHGSDDDKEQNLTLAADQEPSRDLTIPSPLPTFSPRWGPTDGRFPTFSLAPAPKPAEPLFSSHPPPMSAPFSSAPLTSSAPSSCQSIASSNGGQSVASSNQSGAYTKITVGPPRMTSSPKRPGNVPVEMTTPPIAKVRPHQHNGKLITVGNEHIPEEVFDDWLIAKFEQERREGTGATGGAASKNPATAAPGLRPERALTPNLDNRSPDLNGNCSLEAQKTALSHTMPRKTVRFCD